ncbi:stress response translation initiation inhibitor YciH [Gilvimarinus agarilyticus]|uniref:stress response translation initiation inhibitor YciH n=1 Tax=unclassified Gilvimarinus TaxID=2642066 RepID=UPI001C08931B|nr:MULTISPECIES: stress response translation initiation inhibitor YciH [unclassified Gilvimarinus]MBU2887345.1 stress response translation initiation inhibitor YciH [Gilvimarinus agarilyticus]MDO6572004.1 stress response translation initiation inhibitor YciH [Gilvimarinus sp. 2_MG-2023]MDO6746072.1 stress response translation initiation inhibitor YciH [Gilvimarinus sp. 1_MG-2023]
MSKNSRLVYSTDQGRIKETDEPSQPSTPTDGIIRIWKESKGRGGKVVSIVKGLPLAGSELKTLAKKLKQACGTGGAIKDGNVEIQGDHRNTLKTELEKAGYTVKLAGG